MFLLWNHRGYPVKCRLRELKNRLPEMMLIMEFVALVLRLLSSAVGAELTLSGERFAAYNTHTRSCYRRNRGQGRIA